MDLNRNRNTASFSETGLNPGSHLLARMTVTDQKTILNFYYMKATVFLFTSLFCMNLDSAGFCIAPQLLRIPNSKL